MHERLWSTPYGGVVEVNLIGNAGNIKETHFTEKNFDWNYEDICLAPVDGDTVQLNFKETAKKDTLRDIASLSFPISEIPSGFGFTHAFPVSVDSKHVGVVFLGILYDAPTRGLACDKLPRIGYSRRGEFIKKISDERQKQMEFISGQLDIT